MNNINISQNEVLHHVSTDPDCPAWATENDHYLNNDIQTDTTEGGPTTKILTKAKSSHIDDTFIEHQWDTV